MREQLLAQFGELALCARNWRSQASDVWLLTADASKGVFAVNAITMPPPIDHQSKAAQAFLLRSDGFLAGLHAVLRSLYLRNAKHPFVPEAGRELDRHAVARGPRQSYQS